MYKFNQVLNTYDKLLSARQRIGTTLTILLLHTT